MQAPDLAHWSAHDRECYLVPSDVDRGYALPTAVERGRRFLTKALESAAQAGKLARFACSIIEVRFVAIIVFVICVPL